MTTPRLDRWPDRIGCRNSDTCLLFREHHGGDSAYGAKEVGVPGVVRCRTWGRSHPGKRGMMGGLTEVERLAARRPGHGGDAGA